MADKLTRKFRVIGSQAADAPGMNPSGNLNITLQPVVDQANVPISQVTIPFQDPDGTVAEFFIPNQTIELTFGKVAKTTAS